MSWLMVVEVEVKVEVEEVEEVEEVVVVVGHAQR